MHDPILHIKDCYFFEVPKRLWRTHLESAADVKEQFPFLLNDPALAEMLAHDEAGALHLINVEMSGKILIPQPFGTLKNLYQRETGFCLSKFMVIELIVALLIGLFFVRVAGKLSTGGAPRGKFQNLLEAFLLFIRDGIARKVMDQRDADRFTPLFWTLFFFILGCNLAGMVPWAGSPTGAWAVTAALALVTFGTGYVCGVKNLGFFGYWLNLVPHIHMPFHSNVILQVPIWAIEAASLLLKHAILSIRLMANMVAGHLVLLGIMGAIASAAAASAALFGTVATIVVLGSTALSLLELMVAFLQAYLFTFLSALFIGSAIHKHH